MWDDGDSEGAITGQKIAKSTTYVSVDYEGSSLCSRGRKSEPLPQLGLAHPMSPWCVFSQFSLFDFSSVFCLGG